MVQKEPFPPYCFDSNEKGCFPRNTHPALYSAVSWTAATNTPPPLFPSPLFFQYFLCFVITLFRLGSVACWRKTSSLNKVLSLFSIKAFCGSFSPLRLPWSFENLTFCLNPPLSSSLPFHLSLSPLPSPLPSERINLTNTNVLLMEKLQARPEVW